MRRPDKERSQFTQSDTFTKDSRELLCFQDDLLPLCLMRPICHRVGLYMETLVTGSLLFLFLSFREMSLFDPFFVVTHPFRSRTPCSIVLSVSVRPRTPSSPVNKLITVPNPPSLPCHSRSLFVLIHPSFRESLSFPRPFTL